MYLTEIRQRKTFHLRNIMVLHPFGENVMGTRILKYQSMIISLVKCKSASRTTLIHREPVTWEEFHVGYLKNKIDFHIDVDQGRRLTYQKQIQK